MVKLLPEPRSWLRPFDIVGKRFFGSRPKAFKHIPSASKPDKRHGSFLFYPLHFAFLSHSSLLSQSEGPRLPRLKTPFRCRLFVLFLCHSSVRFLSPSAGLLCVLCDVCPSPTGLYPLCAPKGLRACCCSLKRLGEKFVATLQREEKLQPLRRRGTTWSMRGSVIFSLLNFLMKRSVRS